MNITGLYSMASRDLFEDRLDQANELSQPVAKRVQGTHLSCDSAKGWSRLLNEVSDVLRLSIHPQGRTRKRSESFLAMQTIPG